MTVKLNLDECATDASTRRTLSHLSLAVARCKKIVVVTGAGISCSCGIPDFRSSDGLYALVKQQYPDVVLKGRDLFDAALFRDPTSTSVFYTFISALKRSIDAAAPSPTHRFIKTLDAKRKLLRSYTQNIDGLEERAGLVGSSSDEVKMKGKTKIKIKEVRNVQLHGDIHRVRCTFCSAESPCREDDLVAFRKGTPPDCPECVARSDARVARSARALKIGSLRPAIVLYDEPHPLGDDIGSMQTADVSRKPDMLIIMGTSLKVHGFKKLVKDFAKAVHDNAPTPAASGASPLKNTKHLAGKVIFVNKTAPGSEWEGIIDYHVVGETDRWVERVLEEWKKMRPADWEVQKKLTTTTGSSQGFTVTKEISNTVATKGKGSKKPPAGKRENNLPVDDLTKLPPLPPSPSSPGKRRQADCHYNDCSPSKKRDADGRKQSFVFEERGMLFSDTTNVRERDVADDPFDLGEMDSDIIKPKSAPRTTKLRRTQSKLEVVIETRPRPKSRAGTQRLDPIGLTS